MAEKSERAQKEEKILQFWKENKIFEKTLGKKAPKGEFVFYEGPPTANGKPAIHHLEARAFKDTIPRYKTMQGFHVPRKAGWDTHGLPVELQVEKAFGFKSKKDIEAYGIAEFNKECKASVLRYISDWSKFTDRIGYWVNLDDAYFTYDNSYMESVWSILAHIEKRKLLYKDYKVVPWCPRCGTGLSSHELAQPGAYQDIKDLSVYAKFKVIGQENTYFLAWTTTPWTLPGNVALAVGEKIDYVKIKIGEELFILAESRLSVVGTEYEPVEKLESSDIVGLGYEPLYPYLEGKSDKSFKVYAADFVNTDEGTGIVHTAVMYGQDDFELGTKIGLPKYHLVDETGHFIKETGFLARRFVKDEDTAVEIIKDLAHRNLLFKKEKFEHSYPHCWRCNTPLIYYARDSWYIRMSELRNKLVSENEKINWEPEHIKEGRFGEWLREVKDWAVSRERYWGTPLPVWQNSDGSKRIVIDSIETLKKYTKTNRNKFIFIRHGEAESNVKNLVSHDPSTPYHLTQKGKQESSEAAKKIKKADAIYTSPYIRTKETAQIIAEELEINQGEIKEDARLGELNFGELEGKPFSSYLDYEEKHILTYDTHFPSGESYQDAKRRFGEFLYEIDKKHVGETIIVVTHGMGLEAVAAVIEGADLKRSKEIIDTYAPKTSEILEFNFIPLSCNKDFELDLHKPFIDEIVLVKGGEEYQRAKEVIDVWFDSGAMPFAQDPKNILYPADFISEAIDQTRGWFYTLHAIGVLMEKGIAYRNVICLGHLLDKEGKKMSKSLGNVVDPWEEMEKHGADAIRFWMYSVNQPGESKNFDSATVGEINRRVFNILDNVYEFYDLYRDRKLESGSEKHELKNILDKWILARLNMLIEISTKRLDEYKLIEPVRAIKEFVDDLSTWYLRRSRERIKSGDREAKVTMYFVLRELSKLLAPFAPFIAEDLYQKLRTGSDATSVHLDKWPGHSKADSKILEDMSLTRKIASLTLEARSKADIKVRQPLQKLEARIKNLEINYVELIRDEVNVKIVVDKDIDGVELDTHLTPELTEEGRVRDAIRAIQDIRKEKGLKPDDKMKFTPPAGEEEFYNKHSAKISKATNTELGD